MKRCDVYVMLDNQCHVDCFGYLLRQEKKQRYVEATREMTRRKIMVGCLFNGYVLQVHLGHPELLKLVLSKSLYYLNENQMFFFSNSNSQYAHCLSMNNSIIGIDIEYLKDRSSQVYNTYSAHLEEPLKKDYFYRCWLEKECILKAKGKHLDYGMHYVGFEEYLIGIYGPKNMSPRLIIIQMEDVSQYYEGWNKK